MRSRIIIFLLVLFLFPVTAVSATELYLDEEELESIDKAGTYFVQYYVNDDNNEEVSIIRKMHVTFPLSVLDYKNNEGIDASDIKVLRHELNNLSAQSLIDCAKAHAWSMDTGLAVPITSVSLAESKADEKGDYQLIFKTAKGTTIAVEVYEFDEIVFDTSNSYTNIDKMVNYNLYQLPIYILALLVLPFIIYTLFHFYWKRKINEAEEILFKK